MRGTPDRGSIVVVKHTIAGNCLGWPFQPVTGIHYDEVSINAPVEEETDGCKRVIGGARSTISNSLVNDSQHIGLADFCNVARSPTADKSCSQ
jgi:hypothetical protein